MNHSAAPVLDPLTRFASFAPAEHVGADKAVGRIPAEVVSPYPGVLLPDSADPKLETVRVVA